ncbi:putative transcription factor bHLH family [Helianthus debilis subsp. tardiflorus]
MEDSWFNFQWPFNAADDHFSSLTGVGYYDPVMEVMEPSPRPTKQVKVHTSDQLLVNQNLVHGSDCASQGSLAKANDRAFVSPKGTDDFSCNKLPSSYSGNENCYVFSKDFEGGSGGASITSTKSTSRRVGPYQDHILAERKRRETLSQRFIALSALLPNLKKMDKASVLGDAIEYMKTLQEKVETLEKQASKTSNAESRRFEMVTVGGEISSSHENISCLSEQLPEIKARFIRNDVLIRIHCEKKPGVVEKTLAEIEKLHLSVINSNAVIFANSMLHITVVAQMDKDLTMTTKDFVRNLHSGLKQFM